MKPDCQPNQWPMSCYDHVKCLKEGYESKNICYPKWAWGKQELDHFLTLMRNTLFFQSVVPTVQLIGIGPPHAQCKVGKILMPLMSHILVSCDCGGENWWKNKRPVINVRVWHHMCLLQVHFVLTMWQLELLISAKNKYLSNISKLDLSLDLSLNAI